MGGEPVFIEEDKRGLYHAALASAANHLVTLVAQAIELLREAGVADEHISVTAIPTGSAGSDQFFSDREVRPCGRFAAIARLLPQGVR